MRKPGQKRRVTDDELLAVFRESDEPVLRASEVAEQVSISRRGVSKRLENLLDESDLRRKKLGNVVMYYVPAGGTDDGDKDEQQPLEEFQDHVDSAGDFAPQLDEDGREAAAGMAYNLLSTFEDKEEEPDFQDLDSETQLAIFGEQLYETIGLGRHMNGDTQEQAGIILPAILAERGELVDTEVEIKDEQDEEPDDK